MDFLAKSVSEKCSDPMEFLNQLRMTTEPIGGSTIYDNSGELVEYEVAVEAVNKAVNKAVKIDDETIEETDDILRLCYNTILGVTGLDSEEDFIAARKKHDSSLVKRIEKVRARYKDILKKKHGYDYVRKRG